METLNDVSAKRERSPCEPAILVLEDGRCFEGCAGGAPGVAFGQAVFNTSMSGYQELLSDPSSAGQLICLSAPHIGNYGVNPQDMESTGVAAAGVIVRSLSEKPSSHRADSSLPGWLREHGAVAIRDVDTRALTRHLRENGEMRAVIVSGATSADAAHWVEQLAEQPKYSARGFSKRGVSGHGVIEPMSVRVDAHEASDDDENLGQASIEYRPYEATPDLEGVPHIIVVDFGASFRTLRRLGAHGFRITLVPASTRLADIEALEPDGIILSSGPGNPERPDVDLAMLRRAAEVAPTLGISMGHQLLGRAFGADLFELRTGHRGANHPVQEVGSGRVAMTRQYRGYALRADAFPAELEITHINLNDQSVAGFRHRTLPLLARQYDPVGIANPGDTSDFIEEFLRMIAEVNS